MLYDLGIGILQKNGINNRREASNLTEAVKATLYEDYLQEKWIRQYCCLRRNLSIFFLLIP
jgi:hypothetical protein